MSKTQSKQFVTDDDALVTQKSNEIDGKESEVDSNFSDDKEKSESIEDKPIRYSTHKKLLNQHKNLQSELEELRSFRKEIEEKEQLKKGEFEKILKNREERINELQTKLNTVQENITDGKKINAFMEKLPGKVKRNEYLSFVDLDDIAVDPETGKVDMSTVEVAAQRFANQFPDLIEMSTKKDMPNYNVQGSQRPNSISGKRTLKKMTREELREAYLRGEFAEK